MKTLILKIEDSALDKVMWFLEHLEDVVKIETASISAPSQADLKNDPIAYELQKRIQYIDDGMETLTPYQEGMDSMMERIRLKHAGS